MRAEPKLFRRLFGFMISAVALIALFVVGYGQDMDLLAEIEAEIIPAEGTETPYGIPITLQSLPQFVSWWYTLVPQVEADPRYYDALSILVAPCCDDNTAFECCCESGGQACNIIRSGKGLAAHLIIEHDYDAAAISEAVLQWFRFARPDYYLAAELLAQRKSPIIHGLTAKGSCYRGLCTVPISEGGCGGMKELIEPAIEVQEG